MWQRESKSSCRPGVQRMVVKPCVGTAIFGMWLCCWKTFLPQFLSCSLTLQLCLGLPSPVSVQIESNSPALSILKSTLTPLCAGRRGHIHPAQRIDGAHPFLVSALPLAVLCPGGKCSMPVPISCRGSGLAAGGCQEPCPCDSGV